MTDITKVALIVAGAIVALFFLWPFIVSALVPIVLIGVLIGLVFLLVYPVIWLIKKPKK